MYYDQFTLIKNLFKKYVFSKISQNYYMLPIIRNTMSAKQSGKKKL